jgi:phosphatidylglycerophosphate synthase
MVARTIPEALMRAAAPSVVVVGAGTTTDSAELPAAHPEWLVTRLREFAGEVISISDLSPSGWERIEEAIGRTPGPVGIVDVTYVGHTAPLGDTIADPRWRSALLMDDRGFHGVLKIGSADRSAALVTTRSLAAEGAPVQVSLLADRLASSGVELHPVDPGPYVAGFAQGSSDARHLLEQVNETDEHRLRLAASVRPRDGFYSTFVVRKISRRLTAIALRLRLQPNLVTAWSLVIGLAAAGLFAAGTRWALLTGAVLLQVSLVLDCVDGEVARYTRRFTPFGAWLDGVADRVKEFAAYAGLAIGAARSGEDVWLLACSALALLVVRHHVDFGFAVRQSARSAPHPASIADRPWGERVAAWSDRTNRRAFQTWAKRVVTMPIGERWLVISVVASIWGPRAVFVVLLVTGTVAALYMTIGRVLRTASEPAPRSASVSRDLAVLTEVPVLANTASPPAWLTGRLGWLAPGTARLFEALAIIVLARAVGEAGLVAAFGLLAVVAIHLYDLVYRLRHLYRPPRPWASLAVLGSAARPAVLAVVALAGTALFVSACVAMAALVVAVSVVDGHASWIGSSPDERRPEYAEATTR